jgi:hypothetical protein
MPAGVGASSTEPKTITAIPEVHALASIAIPDRCSIGHHGSGVPVATFLVCLGPYQAKWRPGHHGSFRSPRKPRLGSTGALSRLSVAAGTFTSFQVRRSNLTEHGAAYRDRGALLCDPRVGAQGGPDSYQRSSRVRPPDHKIVTQRSDDCDDATVIPAH